MNHFKDSLLRIQTMGIKIKKRKTGSNELEQEITYYDISHENPHLSTDYTNEMKELKEFAITDILNVPKEQVLFHL